jgi:hypothetical protein
MKKISFISTYALRIFISTWGCVSFFDALFLFFLSHWNTYKQNLCLLQNTPPPPYIYIYEVYLYPSQAYVGCLIPIMIEASLQSSSVGCNYTTCLPGLPGLVVGFTRHYRWAYQIRSLLWNKHTLQTPPHIHRLVVLNRNIQHAVTLLKGSVSWDFSGFFLACMDRSRSV